MLGFPLSWPTPTDRQHVVVLEIPIGSTSSQFHVRIAGPLHDLTGTPGYLPALKRPRTAELASILVAGEKRAGAGSGQPVSCLRSTGRRRQRMGFLASPARAAPSYFSATPVVHPHLPRYTLFTFS